MRITIANDWDLSIKPPTIRDGKVEQRGYFAGRSGELAKLTHAILMSRSGSILICGHRGVGKTSLIYKALQQAIIKNNKIIPVILNSTQLDAEKNNKIEPLSVIKNLIRRLYSTTANYVPEEKFGVIETLYKKAVSKEFNLIEQYQKQEGSSISKERYLGITARDINIQLFIHFILWLMSIVILFINLPFPDWINKVIVLLLLLPIPIVIGFNIKKEISKKDSSLDKNIREKLYNFDGHIGNLEYDLEEVHRNFSYGGYKIVYVIDELESLEANKVREILKHFKKLFTLSEALFVFIGDESLYTIGSLRNGEKSGSVSVHFRPPEYTYFSSKFFISRPFWTDLNKYLDDIFVDTGNMASSQIEIIKRALCLNAENDYFDLKTTIKDSIIDFNAINEPILEIIVDSQLTFKARLHKAATVLFVDKYASPYLSKWETNEKLQRKMFDHVNLIFSGSKIMKISDPQQTNVVDSMIRDLNKFLERLEILGLLQAHNYVKTGLAPINPPDHIWDLTEYEKNFIRELKHHYNFVYKLVHTFLKIHENRKLGESEYWNSLKFNTEYMTQWGFDERNPFSNFNLTYTKLKEEAGSMTRKELVHREQQLRNHRKKFYQFLPSMILKMIFEIVKTSGQFNIAPLLSNPKLFGDSALQVRQTIIDKSASIIKYVLYNHDLTRQLLILSSNNLDLFEELNKPLGEIVETHRIITVIPVSSSKQIKGLHVISLDALENSLRNVINEMENFLISS